jgi:hypothetical protein
MQKVKTDAVLPRHTQLFINVQFCTYFLETQSRYGEHFTIRNSLQSIS